MYHRKQRIFLAWALAVAVVSGLVFAAVMWWLSRPKTF